MGMQGRNEEIVGVEILAEEKFGTDGGFLYLRRLTLKNVRRDGSRSDAYVCDFLARPKGVDAVVVVVFWRRPDGAIEVLLRDGLRPPLHVGRPEGRLPVGDSKRYLFFREVVAGMIEEEDRGEEGIRRRAQEEVLEEAGYRVDPSAFIFLGSSMFPSPGAMAERYWLMAVQIDDPRSGVLPDGDGSPMEEGARTYWLELSTAIDACVRGEIEDLKSELVLRRLKDMLSSAG